MEKKTLEKILQYLPVIQTTCNRHGWDGGYADSIPEGCVTDVRRFFDMLQTKIPIAEIPDPSDVFGDRLGCITLLWETELDPEEVTYDTFEVNLFGDNTAGYSSKLESIKSEKYGAFNLDSEEVDDDLIQHIKLFAREKKDDQK